MDKQALVTTTTTTTTITATTKSKAISQYIKTISESNSRTGYEYLKRLEFFEGFIAQKYDFTIDDLTLTKIVKVDIYELLSSYVSYLINKTNKDGYNISPLTIKQRVTTAKNFLEYYDIEVSERKFKIKVKIPKAVRRSKEALSKEDIIKILEACSSIKLKTFCLTLAATGLRSSECCSIRLSDIDFKKGKISIRGEFTKTKRDHYVFLTSELKSMLQQWLDYKYRTRVHYSNSDHKNIRITPIIDDNDFVFSTLFIIDKTTKRMYLKNSETRKDQHKIIRSIYFALMTQFNKVLNQLKIGYEDITKRRHKITLHSFRRAFKTIISNMGYPDFSEWALNHSGSPYYQVPEKEKYELFKKIEPHIIFLDQSIISERHADTQSRLELVEKENLELRRAQEQQKLDMEGINKVLNRIRELESRVMSKGKSKGKSNKTK